MFRTRWLATACTLVVLGHYLGFIVSLDFTATSIMLCMAGLAWACIEAVERRLGILRFLGPGVVFALGMLVRPQGASGALAYALPLAAITAITCIKGRAFVPEAKRLGLAVLLFLLPAILNQGVDTVWRDAIHTPQEAQYEAFNTARGMLMRLSPRITFAISHDTALLASVHWTSEDMGQLRRWQFLDERIYTPESLQTLVDNAPLSTSSYIDVSQRVLERLPPYNLAFFLLAAGVPFFLYLLWGLRTEGIVGLLLPVYALSLTVFMYLNYAFHDRLELPFETGLGFAGLLMAGLLAERAARIKGWGFLLAACASLGIALTGMVYSAQDTLGSQKRIVSDAVQVRRKLDMLNTQFPGSIVLVQPSSLDLNVLSPLEHVELHFQPIDLGWNTFSPLFYRQISTLGIQHGYQLVDAFIDRPNAYILSTQNWCQNLLGYVSDRDKRDIRPVMVENGLCQLREDKKK